MAQMSGAALAPAPGTAGARSGAPAKLAMDGISLAFERAGGGEPTLVLDRVSIAVQPREFVAVVGPSGCGKSTLLRVACGLLAPSAGRTTIDGIAVTGPPPKVGFMFQRDTLLPWADVRANIRIACELAQVPKHRREARIGELVELVRLVGFEAHYPASLSGGMRQRVSLARLLAYDPELYLMDEPFGALDYQTKIIMGRELLRVWEGTSRSIVFVTHDIEETVTLADRVLVMSQRPGRIVAEHRIGLERPRHPRALRGQPQFAALCQSIWADLAFVD